MRPRPVLETLVVIGVVGLLLEVSEGHPLVIISAGVIAAVWLMARSH